MRATSIFGVSLKGRATRLTSMKSSYTDISPWSGQMERCLDHISVSEIFNDFRRIVDSWAASDPGQLKYFGGKSLVAQSHGQSMMSYFRSCYKVRGIYFLDEPETALSPKSQLAFLDILRENGKVGHAQFIIATHSPILLAYEDARIYSFDHSPVSVIKYQETEHYQIYKRFLLER